MFRVDVDGFSFDNGTRRAVLLPVHANPLRRGRKYYYEVAANRRCAKPLGPTPFHYYGHVVGGAARRIPWQVCANIRSRDTAAATYKRECARIKPGDGLDSRRDTMPRVNNATL